MCIRDRSTASELLDNEQLWERGFYQKINDPQTGLEVVYPGAPYKMSESGWRLVTSAPQIGQHNNQVFCDELGLSEPELQELIRAGIV